MTAVWEDDAAPDVETVLLAEAELGEGPVWDDVKSRLIWVDIPAGAIHSYDPATGEDSAFVLEHAVGVAIPRRDGGFVVAVDDRVGLVASDGHLELLDPLPGGDVAVRLNDGNCDSAGRFWVGSVGFHAETNASALYRVDPDYTVTRVVDGITISNGIDWSLDDRLMYYIDSRDRRIDVFDFDLGSGEIANRRVFAVAGDESMDPDGLTVDAEGFVWVAMYGGSELRRYAPDGSPAGTIAFPTRHVTSCAFGGANLDELYVTSARQLMSQQDLALEPSAGALFVCRPGVRGRLQSRFAG